MDKVPLLQTGSNTRNTLIVLSFAVGLGVPALCWLATLCGVSVEDWPGDKIGSVAVVLSVYSPLLAFWTNKGETRTLKQQTLQFGWIWTLANTAYQVTWELPWFLCKRRLMSGDITSAPLPHSLSWAWPFWAYGMADTRYLVHNDLTLAISGMDAAIALAEVASFVLLLRGYRVFAAWMSLVMQACLGWGQFYFYVAEIYRGFSNIHDGTFGLVWKFWVIGLPWLIFPFISGMGFIWFLTDVYKRQGVREYLQTHPEGAATPNGTNGQSNGHASQTQQFIVESGVFLRTDGEGAFLETLSDDRVASHLSRFILVWPWVFLAADIALYWTV